MNKEIFPVSARILLWAISICIFALIALTGYIAIQVAQIDEQVYQLQQTSRPLP